MREISTQEINNVAGGSLWDIITGGGSSNAPVVPSNPSASSIGNALGTAIGGLVDKVVGGTSNTTAGGSLGGGIGSIVDAAHSTSAGDISKNVINAVTGIGEGVIGIGSGILNGIAHFLPH